MICIVPVIEIYNFSNSFFIFFILKMYNSQKSYLLNNIYIYDVI